MRPRVPRSLRKRSRAGELRGIVDEAVALFHRLRWVAELIYGDEGRSTARRGILRGVVRYGPQTVPTLARLRFVTRQHVQEVVDVLVVEKLVELVTNPRHARSRLVRATPLGMALVKRMDAVDEAVLTAAAGAIPIRDVAITVRTLRAVREGFEDTSRWRGEG